MGIHPTASRTWIIFTVIFVGAAAFALYLYHADHVFFAALVGLAAVGLAGIAISSFEQRNMPDWLDLVGDDSYASDIVGESFYQTELSALAGPKTKDSIEFETNAVIVPEHFNKHDKLAVRVMIGGNTVGHLSRSDARSFRAKYVGKGQLFRCKAMIVGGWKRGKSEGSFGVKLDLPK